MSWAKENIGIITALGASVLWGINYVLFEKIVNKVNLFTLMFVDFFICTIITGILCFAFGNFKNDLHNISAVKYTFGINVLIYLLANFLVTLSIQQTNATIAGLLEISYPLFIIIFTYLFFGEINFNFKTIIGGLMILFGIVIVSLNK